VKFGVFGLLTSHMDALAFPEHIKGLTFRREADEARDQVAALKREGADVIVALTHVGFESKTKAPFEGDQTLAREVPGIDLIVGGHSHTFLKRGFREPKSGVLITQAGCYLVKAGLTTLKIDRGTHKLIGASERLVALDPSRGTDKAVQAVVDRQESEVGRVFARAVATATVRMVRAQAGESGLGSWMADCYRARTGADVAIQNPGGIRSDVAAGPLTLREIFSVMPFDNRLEKLTMTGAQLRAALEHGVGPGRVAQLSGALVRYRPSGPAGHRLVSVEVAGRPLDDAKTYTVATLDFLVSGGDGYAQFKGLPDERTGLLARDALRACAESQKTVAPPPPGRLTAVED
jgi:2',3'-cyclic-nucleotide 2'-phosphodiesterase (5'-nucleotidase family)